jgi:putative membrane protein
MRARLRPTTPGRARAGPDLATGGPARNRSAWHDPGMGFVIRLFVSAVALWAATLIFSERLISSVFGRESRIELTDDTVGRQIITLLLVAAIFGVVNAVLRPIIKTIGCAAYALTLGLVAILVNGALLQLTGWIASGLGVGFDVANFWPSAVLGALVIGITSWLLNQFID